MKDQIQFIKQFLGPFANLGRAAISYVMFVHLYVRMERFGSHWKVSIKFDI